MDGGAVAGGQSARAAHKDGDGYGGAGALVKESVSLAAALLAAGAAVPLEVINVYVAPLGLKASSHPVLAVPVNPPGVGYEGGYAALVALLGDAVRGPAEGFDVGVVERLAVVAAAVRYIRLCDSCVELLVLHVLGVVVGGLLSGGVGRVAPDDGQGVVGVGCHGVLGRPGVVGELAGDGQRAAVLGYGEGVRKAYAVISLILRRGVRLALLLPLLPLLLLGLAGLGALLLPLLAG